MGPTVDDLGLGLLATISSLADFGANHLPSRIAALMAIGLGLWMIRDILLPDASWKLEAPQAMHGRMRDWARTSSPVVGPVPKRNSATPVIRVVT